MWSWPVPNFIPWEVPRLGHDGALLKAGQAAGFHEEMGRFEFWLFDHAGQWIRDHPLPTAPPWNVTPDDAPLGDGSLPSPTE